MILPVSNLQAKSSIKQNSEQKNKISYRNQNASSNQLSDRFNKSQSEITFKGKNYGGKEYTDKEISDAKKYMNETGTSWEKKLYKETLSKIKAEKSWSILERAAYGVCTAGFSEMLIRGGQTSEAEAHVKSVSELIDHLHEEKRQKLEANETRQADLEANRRRLDKEAKKAEKRNEAAIAKAEYTNKLNDLHTQLKTEFCEKVNMEKQGSYIEKIPNAIMIEDPYDDVSKGLVDYTRDNSETRFIRLADADNDTLMDNLDETLKKSKDRFDTTKERTLVHVEGFDRLITKGKNSFENIESLKDIMGRTAKDFGSTIIFRTKDKLELVSEAIQPHRVGVQILAHFKSVR